MSWLNKKIAYKNNMKKIKKKKIKTAIKCKNY